jgi:hypothetical protein
MGQEELEKKIEIFKEKIINLRNDFTKETGKYVGIEFITFEDVKFEPFEKYIVVGYDKEVYKRTFNCEYEIIYILEEGLISAVIRLKRGKLEYATIKRSTDIDDDVEIIWKEILMEKDTNNEV